MSQEFNYEDVRSRVENIVRNHVGSSSPLSPETHLFEDLSMDSLELVELGITLEKEFQISLPDAEVRRCTTLNDVVQVVANTLQAENTEKVKS